MAESGEVNTLRGATSTPDASPLKRALVAIEKLQAKLEAVEREKTEPIAIIGIGCRFPGAGDVDAYWQLLREGVDAITVVPPDRWDADAYFDVDPGTPAKMVTRWGGFLTEVDRFDAEFFGLSPREASRMDPQQRLLLECAWEALERGGVAVEKLAGSRTGVFVGISQVDYSLIQFEDRRKLDAYAGTGNALCVAANRISYLFDLRGPSVAMDTACSSSLVTTHLAVESLRRRECDLALAGGVNLILSPELSIIFSHAHMMAADGRCKTFDAAADGYVRGEGCGVLALKRLSDAQRDGDPIVAVIFGSAVNQDGRSNGLTAPNGLAQQAVIRDALRNAKLKPEQVTYIEAHGTGTILGDPIEMNSLAAVMAGRADKCLVGSAKTNIGHLEAAAGVAGLIKAALQIQRGEVAPHLHLNKVNPYIPIDEMPLEIATGLRAWPADRPRLAGVSSFGFGGTNAHVVLGPAPEAAREVAAGPDRTRHLLTLSAAGQPGLRALARRYADFAAAGGDPLADLCYTANAGRSSLRTRAAVVAADLVEMRGKLIELASGELPPKTRRGKVAFLFTGQGSQYRGMGRGLVETAPVFREAVDRCDAVLAGLLPHRLLSVLYGENPALIHDTTYTQPALFAVEYALAQLWQSWGIHPDYLLGHSIGEFVAAVVAGVFTLEDGLRLVAARGRLMGALPGGGAMAAVFAAPEQVMSHLDGEVGLAAVNGPKSVVISGRGEKVATVVARLEAAGLTVRPMTVSHAFHSPLMTPILDEFESIAARIPANPPGIPIVSNLTGKIHPAAPDARYWRRHLREAVQFNAGMQTLAEAGCRVFIEAGPHPTLIGMGKRCVAASEALWLPSVRKPEGERDDDDWSTLLESLGQYWAAGYDVDWQAYDAPYARRKIVAPTYPFQRERHWNESPVAALRRKGWIGGAVAGLEADVSPEGDETAGADASDTIDVDAGAVEGPTREEILDAPFEMRRALLIDAIRGQIGRVLNLPAARIAPDAQLNHLGLDSIMAIELKSAGRYAARLACRRGERDATADRRAGDAGRAARLPADSRAARDVAAAPGCAGKRV
jgi:acyl transferase domain-containing protein